MSFNLFLLNRYLACIICDKACIINAFHGSKRQRWKKCIVRVAKRCCVEYSGEVMFGRVCESAFVSNYYREFLLQSPIDHLK